MLGIFNQSLGSTLLKVCSGVVVWGLLKTELKSRRNLRQTSEISLTRQQHRHPLHGVARVLFLCDARAASAVERPSVILQKIKSPG